MGAEPERIAPKSNAESKSTAASQPQAATLSVEHPALEGLFSTSPAAPPESNALHRGHAGRSVDALLRAQQTFGNRYVQRMVTASGRRTHSESPAIPSDSPGAALDPPTRASMESTFGADFQDVRVHTDQRAASSADGLQARAYTTGRDIYFAAGMYSPGSSDGNRLIAHELTHTLQQASGRAVQASARTGSVLIGEVNDPLELEAERNAEQAVFGSAALQPVSRDPSAAIRRDPVPAAKAPAPIIPLRPTIAGRYPPLVVLLPEADISGLEAASEVRYSARDARTKAKSGDLPEGTSAARKIAKTSVELPLEKLLMPEARFVDQDIWPTLYGAVKAGAPDELTGELVRNEMMRQYFARLKLSLKDPVTIDLIDPEGKTNAPSGLRFSVQGHAITEMQGIISPPDLTKAFGSIETEIKAVSNDAQTVALGAQLMVELEDVEPRVKTLSADVPLNPKKHALNEVKGVQGRLVFDQKYVDTFGKRTGPVPPETKGIAARYAELLKMMGTAVAFAQKWHTENPAGESLGMKNERWGTDLAGAGLNQWDKGGAHYVLGGLAFAGAFVVAFVDAGERVFSFGYHDTATAVSQAYERGDVSWDEGEEILKSAAARALLIAAVTRGLGAATSRLGAAVAGGVGIAARTTSFGLVSGGVSGAFTGAGSVAAQAVLTKIEAGRFTNPAAQAIWNQGMPTGKDLALGIGGGTFLGSLGGASAVRTANLKSIGTTVQTPTGPMKVIAVTKSGYDVLEPIGGRVKIPKPPQAGRVVVVSPDWHPNQLASELPFDAPPSTGSIPPPSGALTVIGAPGAPMVPYAPAPSVPTLTATQALVSGYLNMLQGGLAVNPSSLVSGFNAAKAPSTLGIEADPFGLLPQGPRPFGLLAQGPQPFGLLPQGPQPYGLLPEYIPPSDLLTSPDARAIPGTPGIVVGGKSTVLGKNILQDFGLARSTSFSGWQPHHIIPTQAKTHPVIVKIGMDLDHSSNGIMLPEPGTLLGGPLPTHKGFHSLFNQVALAELNKMDVNLPESVLQLKVFGLQQRLRAGVQAGLPLYESQGGTIQMWQNFLSR